MVWKCNVLLVVILSSFLVTPEGALFSRKSSKQSILVKREESSLLDLPHQYNSIEELKRLRRASDDPTYSKFPLNDTNPAGAVHYSGSDSKVVFVLTFKKDTNTGKVISSNLHRSSDYGKSFKLINNIVGGGATLGGTIITSPEDPKRVYFIDATQSIIYLTTDEGLSFSTRVLSPSTIDPSSFLPHPTVEDWVLALDPENDALYVSRDFGKTPFIKISDNVYFSRDYQWGESPYDNDKSLVYYNTDSASDTTTEVDLYTQKYPYTDATKEEFDPSLGPHDGFVMVDRYIFAQKTIDNKATLWVSVDRKPFKQAKIPSNYEHLNYIVDSVRSLQALVIVQHTNDQFNLYMSEEQGELYNLALADLRVEVQQQFITIDLEVIASMNYTTYIANQFVRDVPDDTNPTIRTLISFNVGANWNLLTPPSTPDSECVQPACSLHLHMSSSQYWRTGVYSQESAPGIIIAHGLTGGYLDKYDDTLVDLYISRDGGSTWSMALDGTWGVSVLDMGGIIIAAKDYHNDPSESGYIQYTCNEGISWSKLTFTNEEVRVFGVLTEPGEATSVASLFGIDNHGWIVITIDFMKVFPRTCEPKNDYYSWTPFDQIADVGCLLGASVAIERHKPSVCCMNGKNYTRKFTYSICSCIEEDFECDYGYKHANGYSGPCVRDEDVTLDTPGCTSSDQTYLESQGYHKIGGDVCKGGVEDDYAPIERSCCSVAGSSSDSNTTPIILGSFVIVALLVIGIFAVVTVVCIIKHYGSRRSNRSGGYSIVPPTYEASSPDEDEGESTTTGVGIQNVYTDDENPLKP